MKSPLKPLSSQKKDAENIPMLTLQRKYTCVAYAAILSKVEHFYA